jgi:hypothetical protein
MNSSDGCFHALHKFSGSYPTASVFGAGQQEHPDGSDNDVGDEDGVEQEDEDDDEEEDWEEEDDDDDRKENSDSFDAEIRLRIQSECAWMFEYIRFFSNHLISAFTPRKKRAKRMTLMATKSSTTPFMTIRFARKYCAQAKTVLQAKVTSTKSKQCVSVRSGRN